MKSLITLTPISSALIGLLLWSLSFHEFGGDSMLFAHILGSYYLIIPFAVLVYGAGLVRSFKAHYQCTPFAIASRSLYVVSIVSFGLFMADFLVPQFDVFYSLQTYLMIATVAFPIGGIILLNASQETFSEATSLEKFAYVSGTFFLFVFLSLIFNLLVLFSSLTISMSSFTYIFSYMWIWVVLCGFLIALTHNKAEKNEQLSLLHLPTSRKIIYGGLFIGALLLQSSLYLVVYFFVIISLISVIYDLAKYQANISSFLSNVSRAHAAIIIGLVIYIHLVFLSDLLINFEMWILNII